MTGRSRIWQVAAVVFTFVNLAGIGWAVAEEELAHALAHVAAQLVGYVVWQLTSRTRQDDPPPQIDERRIEYLQQSVDAIALEVERIGEKQRFSDKLRVERGDLPEDKR